MLRAVLTREIEGCTAQSLLARPLNELSTRLNPRSRPCAHRRQNHPDGQIFSPPYLLKADGTPAPRPSITACPGTVDPGATVTVTTDGPVTAFSFIRVSGCRNLRPAPAPVLCSAQERVAPIGSVGCVACGVTCAPAAISAG